MAVCSGWQWRKPKRFIEAHLIFREGGVNKKFTNEEIENTVKTYGLGPGDTVLILDTTGGGGQTAEQLLSFNIKAIIGNINQLSYYAKKTLIEKQIPLADISDVEIKRIDEIAVIKEDQFLELIEKAEQELEEVITEKKENFLCNYFF